MTTIKSLYECYKVNRDDPFPLARTIAEAQLRQYNKLIAAGYTEDDDLDQIIAEHPEFSIVSAM